MDTSFQNLTLDKKIFEGINTFLSQKSAETNISTYKIENIYIDIFPNVYSPEWLSIITTDAAHKLADLIKDSSFMEIGSGTGILSVFICSKYKNKNVAVTDINPDAINNTKHNFIKNNIDIGDITFYISDVFDSIDSDKKFDYIFWKRPRYISDEPNMSMLSKSIFDYNGESFLKYVTGAKKYLNSNGKLLLFTDLSNVALDYYYSALTPLNLKYNIIMSDFYNDEFTPNNKIRGGIIEILDA